ncbi:MAG: Hydroxyacylglutathione hydrolase [Alphaproteobacteria bacterium MarineAlpha5_Bin9]|nr:MAG: Hydroxyacylglutathione hydrolase [Alphaproteobacteria bacterium MarineAlpha5_Bin9]|tara:strand:+ start:12715 stop:13479 length:765 start_codon:yes stop_codon:yes gene_type:complete
MNENIKIQICKQLKDNYSYIIYSKKFKKAIVIDPSEADPILKFLELNNLDLIAVLITHHHSDHTSGIDKIYKNKKVNVYSPNLKIEFSNIKINNNEIIDLFFIKFKAIFLPGHTNDHVVFYCEEKNILFSGDTIFSLGCGRIFEGSIKDMYNSLQKINKMPDKTMIFCGHEYTLNNLNFLKSTFPNLKELDDYSLKINTKFKDTETTMPFLLGDEKIYNPYLCNKRSIYEKFKSINNYNNLSFFKYIRDLKDLY